MVLASLALISPCTHTITRGGENSRLTVLPLFCCFLCDFIRFYKPRHLHLRWLLPFIVSLRNLIFEELPSGFLVKIDEAEADALRFVFGKDYGVGYIL